MDISTAANSPPCGCANTPRRTSPPALHSRIANWHGACSKNCHRDRSRTWLVRVRSRLLCRRKVVAPSGNLLLQLSRRRASRANAVGRPGRAQRQRSGRIAPGPGRPPAFARDARLRLSCKSRFPRGASSRFFCTGAGFLPGRATCGCGLACGRLFCSKRHASLRSSNAGHTL